MTTATAKTGTAPDGGPQEAPPKYGLGDQPHVLIVDDDTRLRTLLKRYLGENGFTVTAADGAAQARRHLASLSFDLAVIDVMMAGENGLALTGAIRAGSGFEVIDRGMPILLLTARGEPDDRIEGLEAGADDYLAKPFEPKELLLRLHAILRRVQTPAPVAPASTVRVGRWTYNPTHQELLDGAERVALTQAEDTLLQALLEKRGQPVSREELSQRSGLTGNERTIDVQVTRLRRKIEDDPKLPRYLATVRGQGYVLRTDG